MGRKRRWTASEYLQRGRDALERRESRDGKSVLRVSGVPDHSGRDRKLDSLQEYVLVSRSTPRIGTFSRQPEGNWLLTPQP
ncbi:MAG: hypothetical protein ABSH20_11500 [Tepidisphaeraceae bacterium]